MKPGRAGLERREQRSRLIALATAEQRVGAPDRQHHRAARITLDRLPALHELGEVLVAAELLGELGEIREHDGLARRQRERLLQDVPRPSRERRSARAAPGGGAARPARGGWPSRDRRRPPAGTTPGSAPGPAGPNARQQHASRARRSRSRHPRACRAPRRCAAARARPARRRGVPCARASPPARTRPRRAAYSLAPAAGRARAVRDLASRVFDRLREPLPHVEQRRQIVPRARASARARAARPGGAGRSARPRRARRAPRRRRSSAG